jgi:hypothetical protein
MEPPQVIQGTASRRRQPCVPIMTAEAMINTSVRNWLSPAPCRFRRKQLSLRPRLSQKLPGFVGLEGNEAGGCPWTDTCPRWVCRMTYGSAAVHQLRPSTRPGSHSYPRADGAPQAALVVVTATSQDVTLAAAIVERTAARAALAQCQQELTKRVRHIW